MASSPQEEARGKDRDELDPAGISASVFPDSNRDGLRAHISLQAD